MKMLGYCHFRPRALPIYAQLDIENQTVDYCWFRRWELLMPLKIRDNCWHELRKFLIQKHTSKLYVGCLSLSSTPVSDTVITPVTLFNEKFPESRVSMSRSKNRPEETCEKTVVYFLKRNVMFVEQ